MKLIIRTTLLFIFLCQVVSAQYLHQKGKYIVDGNDQQFIIRSMGLGGWMIQEGYMLETSSFANPQYQIRAKIKSLIGDANTETFYNAWLQNHCTKEDVDSMASWGFNAIRLPMHYNLFTLPIDEEPVVGADTWLPKGFDMVDSLLSWCKKDHIYLILDLHGAPGGQGKDAAISDYNTSKPSLWESAENRRKTVALWGKLAARYANETYIGGYDLINETNWAFTPGGNINGCGETNNLPLRELYVNITKAIRDVDKNHMLFIEGNCWAGNFDDLTPAWDTNMAYSFHKYWNETNVSTIQSQINLRNAQNVPLWMGESGENSNQWFYETIKMLETAQVGWSWWPLKKISSVVCPLTVKKTADYQTLLNYWSNGGTKPTVAFATNALLGIAENLKIKNCVYHPDYIDAMFRQQKTDLTIPFKYQTIPGVITASDYDMGKSGIAYADKYVMRDGTNDAGGGNDGWVYRNDGVDIDVCTDTDTKSKGYCIGWIDPNEWVLYTVDVKQAAAYNLNVRYASGGSGGTFHIEKDGVNISGQIKVTGTGGWQSWKSLSIPNVILYEGIQKLKFVFETSGYNLNFIEWKDPQPIDAVPSKFISASTSVDGNSIFMGANKPIDKNTSLNSADFSVKIGSTVVPVSSAAYSDQIASTVVLKIDQAVLYGNIVKVSYNGTTLKSDDGVVLSAVSDIAVLNNTPFRTTLPGQIEAEKYQVNFGLSAETCTDTGAGQDMGHTNAGDYMDYLVYAPTAGTFWFEYRVASTSGGTIELRLMDDPSVPVVIQTVTVPNTGGWQTWKSVAVKGDLSQGAHTLRIFVKKAEFNINWFKVSRLVTSATDIELSKGIEVYPNPVKDQIYFSTTGLTGKYQVKITSLQGVVVQQFPVDLISGTTEHTDLSALADGVYIFSIENMSEKHYCRFIKMKD
ncbi:MAG TPA: glycoside hydrolase family 5 [Prolixibacteraceae bacterium]|jgi:aryl-phospho-beta-D-glucosidase BglC (GH1 family)|nr:glycoside hydrolase family 5 [Prolixibacteraceae bacterium]